MKIRDRNDAGLAVGVDRLHPGVERSHRDRHVGGMGGDAVVAGAEDGVNAVKPVSAAQPEPGVRLLQGFVTS